MRKLNFYDINPVRPVTEDDFKALAKIVGRDLPNSYKEFYTRSNGGRAEENTIYDDNGMIVFSVNDYYSLIQNIETFNNVDNVFVGIQMKASLDPDLLDDPLFIPLGCDGTSNELYLDFNHKEPIVCVCLYDEPDEEAGTWYTRFQIAENLEEFVNSLEKDRGEDE